MSRHAVVQPITKAALADAPMMQGIVRFAAENYCAANSLTLVAVVDAYVVDAVQIGGHAITFTMDDGNEVAGPQTAVRVEFDAEPANGAAQPQ